MKKTKSKIGDVIQSDKFSSGTMTALVIALVMAFNILLYIIVELFGLYFYVNKRDDVTISGNTDALFAEAIDMGKKVKISFCIADTKELAGHDTGGFVYETAQNFAERYEGFVELDFINLVTKMNKDGDMVDLDKYAKDMKGNDVYLNRGSLIFECGENYRVLSDASGNFSPFYTLNSSGEPTSYNGEEVMAASIMWVLNDEHKTVYFTQYHGETADIAFNNLFFCAGYYVDVIDLRKNYVPEDADLVVISSPTGDFETAREGSGINAEIQKLDIYMRSGGNLFVTLDPYVKRLPILEGFLKKWGIEFSTTELSDGRVVRNIVKDSRDAITADGFTLVTSYADNELSAGIGAKVKGYSDGRVIIREACALTLTGDARPLLITSSSSSLSAGGETVSTSGSYAVGAYSVMTDEDKTSRVCVIPSVYLAASDSLVSNGYSNKDFIYALLDDLYGADGMPYGCRQVVYDDQTLQNLTMGTAKLYTALIMVIPAALIVTSVVVTVRRKNR